MFDYIFVSFCRWTSLTCSTRHTGATTGFCIARTIIANSTSSSPWPTRPRSQSTQPWPRFLQSRAPHKSCSATMDRSSGTWINCCRIGLAVPVQQYMADRTTPSHRGWWRGATKHWKIGCTCVWLSMRMVDRLPGQIGCLSCNVSIMIMNETKVKHCSIKIYTQILS